MERVQSLYMHELPTYRKLRTASTFATPSAGSGPPYDPVSAWACFFSAPRLTPRCCRKFLCHLKEKTAAHEKKELRVAVACCLASRLPRLKSPLLGFASEPLPPGISPAGCRLKKGKVGS